MRANAVRWIVPTSEHVTNVQLSADDAEQLQPVAALAKHGGLRIQAPAI